MKNLIILSLLFLSVYGLAQESSTKKFELGLNILSVNSNSVGNSSTLSNSKFPVSWVTGLMFKRNWDKNSLRVLVDYNYSYQESTGYSMIDCGIPGPGCYSGNYEATYSFFRIENRIGYQRSFGNNRLHPFIATDLVIGMDIDENTLRGTDFLLIDGTQYFSKSTYYNYRGGVGLSLGIQYYFTSKFSCSIETGLNYVAQFAQRNYSDSWSKNRTDLDFNGMVLELNPLRLFSVNYHF